MVFESRSPRETADFAIKFAANLRVGDIVRLHGEIGVGKTVFVRAVAEYFGCSEDVCSPTFSIMNIYGKNPEIYHFDLYRLESEDEIYEAGLYEFLEGEGISLVEWPELLESFPPKDIFDITVEKNSDFGDDYRKITVEGLRLENTCS